STQSCGNSRNPTRTGRLRDELPQDVGQDAAVAVVVDLDWRVDADQDVDALFPTVRAANRESQSLARLEQGAQASNVEELGSRQAQALRVDPFLELAGEHAHSD